MLMTDQNYKLERFDTGMSPYRGTKNVACHKGHFYVNIPAVICKQLFEEIEFLILLDVQSM